MGDHPWVFVITELLSASSSEKGATMIGCSDSNSRKGSRDFTQKKRSPTDSFKKVTGVIIEKAFASPYNTKEV